MWDFIVWVVCERECEDLRQQMVIAGFRKYFAGKAFSWDTHETFCFAILSYLTHYVVTHTIYTIITHILRGVLRDKTLATTLES